MVTAGFYLLHNVRRMRRMAGRFFRLLGKLCAVLTITRCPSVAKTESARELAHKATNVTIRGPYTVCIHNERLVVRRAFFSSEKTVVFLAFYFYHLSARALFHHLKSMPVICLSRSLSLSLLYLSKLRVMLLAGSFWDGRVVFSLSLSVVSGLESHGPYSLIAAEVKFGERIERTSRDSRMVTDNPTSRV